MYCQIRPIALIIKELNKVKHLFSSDTKPSKWLDAYQDPVASLYTFTQCITLSDIQADGDWKLIIADLGTGSFNMKLKVYKGKYSLRYMYICILISGESILFLC